MRINMVLPFPVTKPVGGAKVMYEYANRLADLGHTIQIFHSIERPFKKSKTPTWVKEFVFKLRAVTRPKWFPLNARVNCFIVPAITNKYLPDADIVMATWWQMAYAINDLAPAKGKKFNLIQDFEVWAGMEDKVKASYSLPVQHIVIAKYLQELVTAVSGKQPLHIPNAVDEKKFLVTAQPGQRRSQSVIMMYSRELRKGSRFGIAALQQLKEKYPAMQATLFGVYSKPEGLPVWIAYHHKPSNLAALYNSAAIFCSPSLGEGWALPPAEAMACGCAVVCTDIGGHKDYAMHNETALLVTPEDVSALAQAIEHLMINDSDRNRIATNAINMMKNEFSWQRSAQKLEHAFTGA